jgi:hypothetical protein
MRYSLIAVVVLVPTALRGQSAVRPTVGPIQDNSFLVEEAYNQEARVVQHITLFSHETRGGTWRYSFTQEWPLGGQRHQLSYTIPFQHADNAGAPSTGIGDAALNYRYQLVGDGKSVVAVAPRLSLLLPTGSAAKGFGAGTVGVQTGIPVSWVLSSRVVTHWNVGMTLIPSAHGAAADQATTASLSLGQSIVWLVSPRVNLMLETAWTRDESVSGPGQTSAARTLFISPGVRWAFNFASGLQVVPGVAAPIGVGPSAGTVSVLLYLSFEHPF